MNIFITVDLGFGDSGKGTVVDALVRRYSAGIIVRFNGGSQAAHSVYSKAGVHHSFSQFGSTFEPNVYTFLSRYMLVNPLLMTVEATSLRRKGVDDALSRVFFDERALMVTPYHRAVNRLREIARGSGLHGSCGAGIGETMAHSLAEPTWAMRIGDLHNPILFQNKLAMVRDYMRKEMEKLLPALPSGDHETNRQLSTWDYDLNSLFKLYQTFYYKVRERIMDEQQVCNFLTIGNNTLVFEAAQGVLLDENYGFHPYTTWSATTTKNARLILEEAEITEKPTTIGIIRSYMTRHGAGPFPTEDDDFTEKMVDPNNPANPWQHGFRCGPLDLPLLRYALKATGHVDMLAITHVDKVTNPWPLCTHYATGELYQPICQEQQVSLMRQLEYATPQITRVTPEAFLKQVPFDLDAPIGIISRSPGPDKEFSALLESKVDL